MSKTTFTSKVVHDSMAHNPKNKFGLKAGDKIKYPDAWGKTTYRTIGSVTMAGEVLYPKIGYDYDYEVAKQLFRELMNEYKSCPDDAKYLFVEKYPELMRLCARINRKKNKDK